MLDLFTNIISPTFYNILYMSIIGIFVGIFILIIRKVLDKKISPNWKCVIWLLLLVSLIIPIKINIETAQEKDIKMLSLSGLVEPIQDIAKINEEIEIAGEDVYINEELDNQEIFAENDEKTEYGMALINAIQIFQNEKYTAKLLCVTDDDKNMERRIEMVKLSEKFSKNKIIIAIISVIIIIVALALFFTTTSSDSLLTEKTNTFSKEEIEQKYKYEAFTPSFKKSSESIYDDYDFTQDMIYKDNIYYKKINNYEEYSEVKARWNNILDMQESDFENNFMLITAIENTSMTGLTVDKIETDDNNLYISLIHYEDGIEFDENETCISYLISRDLEKDNICVTRNLRDSEKDMSNELQLAEKTDISESNNLSYQYKTEEYRELEKKIAENPENYSYSLVEQNWKDMIAKNFVIRSDEPEIDFSNWTKLGDDFYSLAITNYSDYLKLMNNYKVPDMSWYDFKYIYAIIIVQSNSDTTIDVLNIEQDENGKSYLPITTGGLLDVAEDFKYPGAVVFVPNYRSLESSFLNVNLKNSINNDEISSNQIKLTYYSGYITEIGDNYIIVNNQEKNETQTFYADENNEFLNGRTNQKINISQIKIGDYYNNSDKSIIRNIEGEELKQEMILNMSAGDYYNISNNVIDILNVDNEGSYVIYTIEIEDSLSNSLFFKNNGKFTFKFIANENTKIFGHYDETIYNFAEYAKNQMVTIRIDRNTIDYEYPIITQMEIYDG